MIRFFTYQNVGLGTRIVLCIPDKWAHLVMRRYWYRMWMVNSVIYAFPCNFALQNKFFLTQCIVDQIRWSIDDEFFVKNSASNINFISVDNNTWNVSSKRNLKCIWNFVFRMSAKFEKFTLILLVIHERINFIGKTSGVGDLCPPNVAPR